MVSHELKYEEGQVVKLVALRFGDWVHSGFEVGNEVKIIETEIESRSGHVPKDWQEYLVMEEGGNVSWVCESDLEPLED